MTSGEYEQVDALDPAHDPEKCQYCADCWFDQSPCEECDGTGRRDHADPCPRCDGHGFDGHSW